MLTFYVDKYPYLDISTNTLRATLDTSTAILTAKTKDGKIWDFTQKYSMCTVGGTTGSSASPRECVVLSGRVPGKAALAKHVPTTWLEQGAGSSFCDVAGTQEELEFLKDYLSGRVGLCRAMQADCWQCS